MELVLAVLVVALYAQMALQGLVFVSNVKMDIIIMKKIVIVL